jgi:hypothetical protein
MRPRAKETKRPAASDGWTRWMHAMGERAPPFAKVRACGGRMDGRA